MFYINRKANAFKIFDVKGEKFSEGGFELVSQTDFTILTTIKRDDVDITGTDEMQLKSSQDKIGIVTASDN